MDVWLVVETWSDLDSGVDTYVDTVWIHREDAMRRAAELIEREIGIKDVKLNQVAGLNWYEYAEETRGKWFMVEVVCKCARRGR